MTIIPIKIADRLVSLASSHIDRILRNEVILSLYLILSLLSHKSQKFIFNQNGGHPKVVPCMPLK